MATTEELDARGNPVPPPMSWYTEAEMVNYLRGDGVEADRAKRLGDTYARNLQMAFDKGRSFGLRHESGEEVPPALAQPQFSTLEMEVDGCCWTVVNAMSGPAVIGQIELQVDSYKLASFRRLFVVPNWRGKGIGRTILNQGLKIIAARGATAVGIDVKTANFFAYKLYIRMGFRVVHCDADEYLMVRFIAPPECGAPRI